MISTSPITFIGCLYQSKKASEHFDSYASICKKTIETSKELFPNSTFELHLDTSVNSASAKSFHDCADRVIVHEYPTRQSEYPFELASSTQMRKINSAQLTKCMRLAPLFDNSYFNNDAFCVVVDIHDDFHKTAKLIHHYTSQLSPEQNYIFTRWQGMDSDCPYFPKTTKKTHLHFDAGLVIARAPIPSRDDLSFLSFCQASIMNAPARLAGGAEEMLMDEYLESQDFYSQCSDQYLSMRHACKVDHAFYEENRQAVEQEARPSDSKKRKHHEMTVVKHEPHSKALNLQVGAHDIYVCAEKKPKGKSKG